MPAMRNVFLHLLLFATLSAMTTNARKKHVEKGYVRCGAAQGYNDGSVGLYYPYSVYYPYRRHSSVSRYFPYSQHRTVTFDTPYSSPPKVFLSEVYRMISNQGPGKDRFGLGVLHVTNTGFTMACGTWTRSMNHGSYSYVWKLEGKWMSVSDD